MTLDPIWIDNDLTPDRFFPVIRGQVGPTSHDYLAKLILVGLLNIVLV